jgi:hypothetical protein
MRELSSKTDLVFIFLNIGDQRVKTDIQIGINTGGTALFGD